MKIGIAGVGFMGTTHAASWQETGATLAGFVAETTEEAQGLAEKYGARVYPMLEDLLQVVDVIDICTPTHLHHAMVLQAAAAGKHIVCEKPLALSVSECSEMILACQDAGVQLFIAHVVRYFPEYALAKKAVEQGQIGRVATMRLRRGSFRPKKAAGNWFLDESKSGGLMLDLMIHDFDYARWVAGEVESVFAKRVTQFQPQSDRDFGIAILSHRNGAISQVAGAWAYPPPTFRTGFEISGDGGMIDFDSEATAPIANLIQKPSAEAPDVGLPSSPIRESPYTTQIREFYAALTQGKPVRVTPHDGLAAVQIALAAIESTRTGQAVQLTPRQEVLR